MKRFAFWFVAAILAVSWVSSRDHRHGHGPPPPRPVRTQMIVRTVAPTDKASHGQKVVVVESDDERIVLIDEKGVVHISRQRTADNRRADAETEEERLAPADGLPVAIVPGTRVTEARIEPPRHPEPPKPARIPETSNAPRGQRKPIAALAPKTPVAPKPAAQVAEVKPLVVAGRLSATEDRAVNDARAQLMLKLPGLLESQVPREWPVPKKFIDGMIRETKVVPVERDYGTMYQATMLVDVSPAKREQIASTYRHEQVVKRLATLGGLLAFVLVCLSTLSGYIRADEATKGYYTNRLRLAAAAGVGVAGTVIYQLLT